MRLATSGFSNDRRVFTQSEVVKEDGNRIRFFMLVIFFYSLPLFCPFFILHEIYIPRPQRIFKSKTKIQQAISPGFNQRCHSYLGVKSGLKSHKSRESLKKIFVSVYDLHEIQDMTRSINGAVNSIAISHGKVRRLQKGDWEWYQNISTRSCHWFRIWGGGRFQVQIFSSHLSPRRRYTQWQLLNFQEWKPRNFSNFDSREKLCWETGKRDQHPISRDGE